MRTRLNKTLAILLALALFVGLSPISGLALVQDPKIQTVHADKTVTSYKTLADAVAAAVDGDVINLAGEVMGYETSETLSVTKKITFKTGKSYNNIRRSLQYKGTSAPLFTIENGGVLTVTDCHAIGNTNATVTGGGFVLVKKGGTLVLDGTTDIPVIIEGFALTAQNAKGGAIYVEQGGKVTVADTVFSDNAAAKGADLYAEQRSDVSVAEGITLDAAYGESVDISGLNLLLDGEIGLVFHTAVPDKYLDGSFVLTCPTGETVTYPIASCEKDTENRLLAAYNLSAIELSQPVTLTVCDKTGAAIAAKTESAEGYGKVILAKKDVTEKEKAVVRTLLNYGHFAQIECADYNGWIVGEDYAETAKYADLTAGDDVFDAYGPKAEGYDPTLSKMGVQLRLGYKTDIRLCFPGSNKPTVKVNGKAVEVEDYTENGYSYRAVISGISALALADEFTVAINGRLFVTLSAMSYCKLSVDQQPEININAVKALYEFYMSTVAYHTAK